MTKTKERCIQLADAYEAVARTNHYMVGVVEKVTFDELCEAEQELIHRQNDLPNDKTLRYWVLDFALDLIEAAMKQQ